MIKKHKNKGSILLPFIFTAIIFSSCSSSELALEEYKVVDSIEFSYNSATVYFAMTDRFYDGNPDNNTSYGRVQDDALGKEILRH